MIAQIVAVNNTNTIGKNNKIPWHSTLDLKYFKSVTENSTVIMGRKTFESLGKPLKNRQNIVITSSEINNDDIIKCNSIENALKYSYNNNIFFIGGSRIYNESLKYCEKLFITRIDNNIIGDTFYNLIIDDFVLTNETNTNDVKSNLSLKFQIFERINNG